MSGITVPMALSKRPRSGRPPTINRVELHERRERQAGPPAEPDRDQRRLVGRLSVFGLHTTVGVEHARPILLMCRNYCRLLEGSSMLDPYNEHHPATGYARNLRLKDTTAAEPTTSIIRNRVRTPTAECLTMASHV